MNNDDFRKYGHELVERIADYFQNIDNSLVMPDVLPGATYDKLPDVAPDNPELTDDILSDFEKIIMPGMTNWNSPSFHGYFPANNSYPSILAEFLTAGIGAQCMMWQTSPAATELEEKMMLWLRKMIGLPDSFTGVIQDTASTSTLVAMLTARERQTGFSVNSNGLSSSRFRVYCSTEAHSSVEKAVKIAGIGKNNLVKIPVDYKFSLIPSKLDEAIKNDIESGYTPLLVVAAFGTTGSLAVDPISDIATICDKYKIWLHVDAAYLGTALILPEYRHLIEGIDCVDSFVFNPHKWMLTNFDCSAYFVRDTGSLIKTFAIMPEYLKTAHDEHVNNYRDWGIQLGRKFRALKLWFVIRTYGIYGLREKVRHDIELGRYALSLLMNIENIETLAPVDFNVICFRYNDNKSDNEQLNLLNEQLLKYINKTGEVFLSHTKLNHKYTIRLVLAQTYIEKKHVDKVIRIIKDSLTEIKKEYPV